MSFVLLKQNKIAMRGTERTGVYFNQICSQSSSQLQIT